LLLASEAPAIADIQTLQRLRFDQVDATRCITNSGPPQIDLWRLSQWHLRTPTSFKIDQGEKSL